MDHRELINLSMEAISNFVVIDQSGIIVYMNQVYADMLGEPLSDLIGHPASETIPGTKLPEILKTGKPQLGEMMEFRHQGTGEKVRLICNRIPLISDGQVVGACAITLLQDMDEINRLYADLNRLQKENEAFRLRAEMIPGNPLEKVIGESKPMLELKNNISTFALSDLTILLTGETGVGKEVFANAIHQLSSRRTQPFIKINCAAIPRDLLESELFGYEAGAFTGASKTGKAGKFELADNGTLLLDEIGEIPAALQAKLLRVLQEGEVERIGGKTPKKINVRLICATNIQLKEKIAAGEFREDLYYRINTVELSIPPLRQRKEDIPALCQYLIRQNNEKYALHTTGMSETAMDLFLEYGWPGNVRELQHVLERLSVLHPDSMISDEHCAFLRKRMGEYKANRPFAAGTEAAELTGNAVVMPGAPQSQAGILSAQTRKTQTSVQSSPAETLLSDIRSSREKAEADAIRQALIQTGGNRTKAAEALGISRAMLYNKLKKYGFLQT